MDGELTGVATGLPIYAEMKDSGVEWLGRVPAHWEVRRIGQLGHLSKGRGGSKEDETAAGVACVRYGDLYTTHEYFIHSSRSAVPERVADEYSRIEFGDVLFATSGETLDEIGKSAVNLIHSRAVCGGDILLFRCKRQANARYLGYATGSRSATAQKARMGRGITVMHVYGNQLKRLAVPFPPLPEQSAIVRYLDHMNRRIRRAIRSRERLVELLAEQKQAAIEQAVTGGIDVRTGRPYPAYKDCGVEWLGQVPAHWKIRRNGRLFVERNEIGFKDLPILEVSLRTGVRVRDMVDGARKQRMENRSQYKRAAKGDIAYNMMRAWQGATGVVPADGLVSPAYVVAKPLPGTEALYSSALFRLRGYKQEIDSQSRGIVPDRNRLYWEAFKRMRSPHPPSAEQTAIVRHLERLTANTATASDRAERQIALLREYGERLTADVVTGKVDVWGAAANLPEVVPLDTVSGHAPATASA